MQPMHPQYFPGQPSSQYPGFPNLSLMPPASGISIPNAAIPSSQQAPGSKSGAGGQKRKQVKNACVNCQKACKKCDEGRPCQRCIKYGLTDTCQDSTRKERKKGIKRGPYKRRQQNNQSANASASPSNVPLGNPMVTPQTSYSASPSMRGSIPFPYTTTQNMNQFSPGYEAMNHHYGYAPSFQKDHLMGQSYMAPPTIFPAGNPALTYHPMVAPPQQPEILSRSASPSPLLPHNTFGGPKISQIPHPSQTPTPASSIHSPSNAASPNPADNDEDDGSKLAILSQLCSNVLDSNDQPKHEEGHHSHFKKRIGGLSNQTPPPSPHNAHTRTPSYDHDQSHPHSQQQVYHPSHNSSHHQPSHYTLNGHLSAPRQVPMIYGTPNSSPSSSPTDTSFSIPVNGSPKVSQSHQPPTSTTTSPQSSFWIPSSLPPLQSVVAEHYPYSNNHFQPTGAPHGQSHSGSNDWVGGSW